MKDEIASIMENQKNLEITGTRLTIDPLMFTIIGAAVGLAVLVIGIALFWGSGPVLAAAPWYIPLISAFNALTTLSVAYLALGRYHVLRDPISYWAGMGFAAYGIGQIFYALTWPGLLPGGGSILGYLTNTPAVIAILDLTILDGFLLAAVLVRWPGKQDLLGRRWLRTVAAWLVFATLLFSLLIVFEPFLPVFAGIDGRFTSLQQAWVTVQLFFFAAGSIFSILYYQRNGDNLAGYISFPQMALVFVHMMVLIGGKRYDLWWYTQRVILASGYLIVMFGLLSEYARLLWRESEGRLMLEAILANVPIGLAITGGPPDFRLQRVSRYGLEMNQRPAEELVDLPAGQHQAAWKIMLPDGVTQPLPEQMPLYRASRHGEEIWNLEMVMETGDGRKIPVLVNAAPIRGAQGQIVAAINTWQDITDIKQAEEALHRNAADLERSNLDLQEFAFVASHDLQEPLRKIEAFGDLLLENPENLNEYQRDLLMRMRKSANRMRDMVDGLLQLSRVETQAQPFQPVDLGMIVREVLSDLELQIRQSEGAVDECELPVIEADPLQMRRLFQNLLGNALKFQPPGGKPHVKVCTEPSISGYVQILIADNGIGFDEDYAGHIFEPFQRLVGRSEYEGSGMGLAICRKIVNRHSGKITAHSKPEHGTSFMVTLPVQQNQSTHSITRVQDNGSQADHSDRSRGSE